MKIKFNPACDYTAYNSFQMALHRISKTLENPVMLVIQSSTLETRLQPLMFSPLNSDGSHFLEWLNDAKTVLAADDSTTLLKAKRAEEIPTV